MDIDLSKLNALFVPYDLNHLLVVWSVLTAFLLIFGTIISATGIYPNARHFWKMQLAVLGGVYLVSAVSFLLMHLNAVGVVIVLLTLALIILGRVGAREEIGPLEDWWLFRLWEREQSSQDQEQCNCPLLPAMLLGGALVVLGRLNQSSRQLPEYILSSVRSCASAPGG